MRTALRHTLTTGLIATMMTGAFIGTATTASATVHYDVKHITRSGCTAKLDMNHTSSGKWYARGRFIKDPKWNVECRLMLQRQKGSGSWKRISDIYTIENGMEYAKTGWHPDGRGYRARVCLQHVTEDTWHCSGSY
jgi:hypothetical protein